MPRTAMIGVALSATLLLGLSGCGAGLVGLHPAVAATGGGASASNPVVAPGGGDVPAGVGASGPVVSAPTVSGPVTTLAPAASPSGTPASSPSSSASAALVARPIAGAGFTRSNATGADTVHLRFDIMSFTRQGSLLQLVARITNTTAPVTVAAGAAAPNLSWEPDGLSAKGRSDITVDDWESFSALTLTDPVARKRYLVAADSSGRCVCTAGLWQNYDLAPGDSLALSATYAAPPAATTHLDVDVPGIGSFADVAIS